MRKSLFYIFLIFLAFSSNAQQLKLGNNPTQIEKSAVLELESPNQGLLLTRVSDTTKATGIDALNPPDGMIIYFTDSNKVTETNYGPGSGVYQRKDGYWERLPKIFVISDEPYGSDNVAFTKSHDTITLHLPDASDTTNGIVSGAAQKFIGNKTFVDSVFADILLMANKMYVKDSLILESLPTDESVDAFLTTDNDGNVKLDTIDRTIFWKVGGNSQTQSKVGTINNRNLKLATNKITRMLITSGGKVGIGTTDPAKVTDTLTVNGSFRLGTKGSSFIGMVHDSANIAIPGTSGHHTVPVPLPNIENNADVIVNPRKPLKDDDDNISIIAYVVASPPNILIHLYNPTSNNIDADVGNITFDIYYLNPKN